MTNVKDYRTFEELEKSIRGLKEDWKKATEKSNKELTFAGIQRQMQYNRRFIEDERNLLERELVKLKDVWSDKVVLENRAKLLKSFEELVQNVTEALRQDVKSLSAIKLEKIGDMLATPPAEEQLRLLQVLQMRGDIDSLEVHTILPVFFNNYQSMRVLSAISEQNGIILNLPVQLDCHTLFDSLNEATDYLLRACDEVGKEWKNVDISYHAFFTVNDKERDKQYDPVYQQYIDLLDSTPQLQECKTEKKYLSKAEQARIDWYMREVSTLDREKAGDYTRILKRVNELVTEQPDMLNLLRLSQYKEFVEAVEKPDVKDGIKENAE